MFINNCCCSFSHFKFKGFGLLPFVGSDPRIVLQVFALLLKLLSNPQMKSNGKWFGLIIAHDSLNQSCKHVPIPNCVQGFIPLGLYLETFSMLQLPICINVYFHLSKVTCQDRPQFNSFLVQQFIFWGGRRQSVAALRLNAATWPPLQFSTHTLTESLTWTH